MRPTLATLPVELLTAIAYELAVANQPEPSPPTDLIPLLLASSYFYNHLSLEHNTPLYARILHATWDTAACSRRFGRDVLRDSRVAAEDLRARWVLVQGVKTRGALGFPGELGSEEQRELVRQDLVAIYLLLTENGTLRSPLARLLPRAVASVPRLTSMWLRVCIDGRNLPGSACKGIGGLASLTYPAPSLPSLAAIQKPTSVHHPKPPPVHAPNRPLLWVSR
jgi:hypothetical protein